MATVTVSKNELTSESTSFLNKINVIDNNKLNLINSLKNIPDLEGMGITSTGNILASNIENAIKDLKIAATNIKNYCIAINNADASSEENMEIKEVVFSLDAKTDGSTSGNIIAIWSYLKAKGLSDNAIAGILGNISAESSFNPGAIEGNGEGHGLIQWSFGRKNRLLARAQELGVDWRNLKFQLDFLWDESLDPNSSYGKKLASVGFYNDDISIEDAAFYFHKFVEVSADSKARIQKNRINKATSLYNEYKDKVYATSSTVTKEGSSIIEKIENLFGKNDSTGAIISTKEVKSLEQKQTEPVVNTQSDMKAIGAPVVPDNEVYIPNDIKQSGYTVTGYDYWIDTGNAMVWASNTNQRAVSEVWKNQGSNFTNGIATINIDGTNRYLVALSQTYGKVGDKVDVVLENGTTIPCIIADAKSKGDYNYSMYGHQQPDGSINILEFEVQRSKYLSSGNPTTTKWNLSWDSSSKIVNITNQGSIL